VTLDGELLDVREGACFVGIAASHELAAVPHAVHRADKDGLCRALDRSYWEAYAAS
jgi:hypothetical protein